ncbi:hypothetical protein HYW55_01990 [Candidatus Gottesmanbacteria bacterium]|nr:hypothetical protein [Candidatus Gottesmanbacteria bacterium]
MEIVSQPQDDIRVEKLERFFEAHNSPLSTHAELLVSTADAYNLPWTLVAAISGVESGFCRRIPSGSSNCWGWNNGNSSFDNLSHAVYIVSRTLRYRYFDRGLDTPEKMSRIYAPPSHTWAGKVRHFMAMIENTEFENSPPIDL